MVIPFPAPITIPSPAQEGTARGQPEEVTSRDGFSIFWHAGFRSCLADSSRLVLVHGGQQLFFVVDLSLERNRRPGTVKEHAFKLLGEEAGIFPVDDSLHTQRLWVDDDIVRRQVVVAEDEIF